MAVEPAFKTESGYGDGIVAINEVSRRLDSSEHTDMKSYLLTLIVLIFFFSSRRRHTRSKRDWSSDVCSSDLQQEYDRDILADHGISRKELTPGVRCPACGWLGMKRIYKKWRSEERRVGKECMSWRWSPPLKQKVGMVME